MLKNKMFGWKKLLIATACAAAAGAAHADSNVAGTIISLWTVGAAGGAPGNYDFRVYLSGYPVFCNGQTWVYLNSTEANYSAMVSNLMEAKALGSNVTLYFQQDSTGFCHLSLVTVNN